MKAYTKNIARDITTSKSRFFSILIIVALGVAFFAGVRATSPNMKLTADQYLDRQNVHDIMILSPTGLTEDDIEKVKAVQGVKNVYPSVTFDAYAVAGDNQKAVKVHSLEEVNRPLLVDGELPKKDNEVVTEQIYLDRENLVIGDTITLKAENGTKDFTVTGTVHSPLYVNNTQRGTNTLGTGTTEAFLFITQTAAKELAFPAIEHMPTMYTELYITVVGAKELNTFEDAYEAIVRPVKEKIEDLHDEWIVLDRDANAGIVMFREDAGKIAALGNTFPLIFFVVATMVCLTSMTRMVEEQRMQIGTLKALGYGKGAIITHYLLYALLASIFGSIIGVLVGMPLFPTVIFNAYSSMYDIPDFVTKYHLDLALSSGLVAILLTSVAAVLACMKELVSVPAMLMRPKAPKMGKRILLERIPFIWNRLSFIGKVTMRNLFRYKKRFFMTVIGIAACTGLLVTGFGLRTSISSLAPKQFEQIFQYDMEGMFATPIAEANRGEKQQLLEDEEHISQTLFRFSRNATARNKENVEHDAYLFVPENTKDVAQFINLNDRGNQLEIPSEGAIITEKLSTLLGVRENDTIKVDLGGETVQITVKGITEQYVSHYIYISREYYESLFEETFVYNGFLANLENMDGINETELAEEWIQMENLSRLVFMSTTVEELNGSMDTIDTVVLVLIVSAAALAFVVMYNLTTININERMRELATIKVLGFYDKEIAAYVYRESMLLTFIGTGVGLIFGVFLKGYVLGTAETDMLLFPRTVSPFDFIYSAILTILFAGLVNVVMYRTLKKIDMIESLKSAE